MMAQCTTHTQLKAVYGVSRVTCHCEPGPPITSQKVRGPEVEAILREVYRSPFNRDFHVLFD